MVRAGDRVTGFVIVHLNCFEEPSAGAPFAIVRRAIGTIGRA